MDLMPFDELNALKATLPQHFEDGKIRSRQDAEDIIDELLDLFLLAYANGVTDTNETLGSDIRPSLETVMETVDRQVAGQTWRERVIGYWESGGTQADIMRIAETEAHRDSNEAAYLTAREAGATEKVWHCMMLPTSRDTHIYLNNVSAPIDGEFYTFNGDKAQFPGQFGIAEEDCGCLCYVTYR